MSKLFVPLFTALFWEFSYAVSRY